VGFRALEEGRGGEGEREGEGEEMKEGGEEAGVRRKKEK